MEEMIMPRGVGTLLKATELVNYAIITESPPRKPIPSFDIINRYVLFYYCDIFPYSYLRNISTS